jgi:hypothetical protein
MRPSVVPRRVVVSLLAYGLRAAELAACLRQPVTYDIQYVTLPCELVIVLIRDRSCPVSFGPRKGPRVCINASLGRDRIDPLLVVRRPL